jgi:hypothetical protein
MLQIALSILIYPGLVLALALGLLLGWLGERRLPLARPPSPRALLTLDGAAASASMLLAGLALALLPWPYHLAASWPLIGQPVALWCALEGSFWLAQLAGALAPAPLAARGAARELQMSAAGRCVVWLAIGCALWGGAGWSLIALPGRLLVGLAGALALPAAIGAGPFGAELSLSAAGAEEGLDEGPAALVRLARQARGAALLAALAVASAPRPPAAQPWASLLLIIALFAVAALLLRQMSAAMPRLTLPAALRWCWWRALPLALAGLSYMFFFR